MSFYQLSEPRRLIDFGPTSYQDDSGIVQGPYVGGPKRLGGRGSWHNSELYYSCESEKYADIRCVHPDTPLRGLVRATKC